MDGAIFQYLTAGGELDDVIIPRVRVGGREQEHCAVRVYVQCRAAAPGSKCRFGNVFHRFAPVAPPVARMGFPTEWYTSTRG